MAKSKEVKRAEAAARQERYENTPTFGKLAKIAARPGESKRERDRLLLTVGRPLHSVRSLCESSVSS